MTGDRLRVLVLDGGPDRERPVSLASGRAVTEALAADPGLVVEHRTIDRPDARTLAGLVEAAAADVVMPVLHGPWGEGGPLQQLLDAIGVPFVGADAPAAALAMDKDRTKARFSTLATGPRVSTPDWTVVRDPDDALPEPPLVLKPVDDGSSVDLTFCPTREEARAALPPLLARRGRVLAERRVTGREITVGLLGPGPEPLPLVEIRPAGAWYDYAAKYERSDTRYRVGDAVPPLAPEAAGSGADGEGLPLEEACRRAAVAVWRELGVRDLARVDFLVGPAPGEHEPRAWFLELNTMPGFTGQSLLPRAAAAAGIGMTELVGRLVRAAASRGAATPAGARAAPAGRFIPPP